MCKYISYVRGRVSVTETISHLNSHDGSFTLFFGRGNSIEDYAIKISELAECFQAWQGGSLVGLVAVYCNAPDRGLAFITYVGVLPDWRLQGIASRLMQNCIAYISQLNFCRIELEVDRNNLVASSLYRRYGFNFIQVAGESARMMLVLRER